MSLIRICAFCNEKVEETFPHHFICYKCNCHCSHPLMQTLSQSIMFNMIDNQLIFEDVQKYICDTAEYPYTLSFIFEKNSKVFNTNRCKRMTHMLIKVEIYILMIFAVVDLTYKYNWGCNKESVLPCCLISNNE
jgi:hypothetical protein